MAPELYEQENEAYPLNPLDEGPEYVGAPSEFAEEVEVSEAVGLLATIMAGIGLLSPLVIALMVLLFSGFVCALVVILAGLAAF